MIHDHHQAIHLLRFTQAAPTGWVTNELNDHRIPPVKGSAVN